MSLRLMQAAAVMVLAACGAAQTANSAESTSEQQSAAPAQQANSGAPFRTAEVARFEAPWAIEFLRGNDPGMRNMALVTNKTGTLWLIDVATGRRQQVAGVPSVKVEGQGGLGDVVLHPGFAGNQRIYLSFVEAGPGDTSGAAVGYGRLNLASGQPRIEGFKVIWRQTPKVSGSGHFAHRIAFAPDGTMFVSSGERMKGDPAQDRGSDLGKIIHMTAEGERLGGRFHTLGHRNILGLAFAPDGRLWAAEMGPKGGDEFNLIVRGRNYGWPVASYGSGYGDDDIPDEHRGRGFEEPRLWWNGISPGGMMIYSGDLFRGWKGDAFIGGLSGQALVRVDVDGADARKAEQWPMGARIRAVEQGPNGEIYVLEDARGGTGGRLLKLTPAAR
jgi:glucose/arabinose dehydrogenase